MTALDPGQAGHAPIVVALLLNKGCMFYYYGRKKKLVKRYPAPLYDTIIEPFAGSAAYSVEHGEGKRVILVEKDKRIATLWQWFTKIATPEMIRNMPDAIIGEQTTDFLKMLHSASKRAFDYKTMKVTKILACNWNSNKEKMATTLPLVKHFEIVTGDYTEAPDIEATWFIDPPYPGDAGMGYACGSNEIDYQALAQWTMSRKGQVIVCGNAQDTWLPFQPLCVQKTINGKQNNEGIWIR